MVSREFHITEKTPHNWLASQTSFLYYDVRRRIALDMVANARELTDAVNWGVILDNVESRAKGTRGTRYTGWRAIAESVAITVGVVAARMEWDMHSPQIVYMSGYHPAWVLGKKIDRLNQFLADVEEGTKVFVGEKEKAATVQTVHGEIGMLGTFKSRIGEALTQYAQQNLSGGEKHLEVLQALIYSPSRRIGSARFAVFDALKREDYQEAYALVEQSYE